MVLHHVLTDGPNIIRVLRTVTPPAEKNVRRRRTRGRQGEGNTVVTSPPKHHQQPRRICHRRLPECRHDNTAVRVTVRTLTPLFEHFCIHAGGRAVTCDWWSPTKPRSFRRTWRAIADDITQVWEHIKYSSERAGSVAWSWASIDRSYYVLC
jgi:hypothetical protein